MPILTHVSLSKEFISSCHCLCVASVAFGSSHLLLTVVQGCHGSCTHILGGGKGAARFCQSTAMLHVDLGMFCRLVLIDMMQMWL